MPTANSIQPCCDLVGFIQTNADSPCCENE